jgi:hypothetical protein
LTAEATDADGTISKVGFFNGTTLLSTSTAAPYTFDWLNVPPGTYSVTAKATDNLGGVKTTPVANLTVKSTNIAPTVSITDPANGTTIVLPINDNTNYTPITTLKVNTADADGVVVKVEYYNYIYGFQDGISGYYPQHLLGTATYAPFSYVLTTANNVGGLEKIVAVATDDTGAITTSAPVNIGIDTPISITVSSPIDGAALGGSPSSVIIRHKITTTSNAWPYKIEFYNGAVLLDTFFPNRNTYPIYDYWRDKNYIINNLPAGMYNLIVKVSDEYGLTASSKPVNFTIKSTNILPEVNIIKPLNNISLAGPTSISFDVFARDNDGDVRKLEFFNGDEYLGNAERCIIGLPWCDPNLSTFKWVDAPVGNHSVTAKATDNTGAVATSSPISIFVTANNIPPNVTVTLPGSGAIFGGGRMPPFFRYRRHSKQG